MIASNALVLAGVLVGAVYLGEDVSDPMGSLAWIALDSALAAGAVLRLTKRQRRSVRFLAALALVAVAGVGFLVGSRSRTRAYNECVEHGEAIRGGLRRYMEREGHYPATLEQAVAQGRMCLRPLRGTILRYSTTGHAYELQFGDHLVTWRATDREAFIARK
ncbi:hypothetical protein [Anaeromyxobacter diazotrophicus]|uniref:Uncharacterized protein n=1 Tax=Anaeromyxobacter diazotrophicus TaxID=2590199 RepID=A0A7I9VMW5_9BACT|nr:hypothetical protein [Anaeromyxobacter diazotrophicus]GEJ57742.1 hypothetical protein AMYX_24830 [Anaeromyxobacter diazotrophicus]